MIDIQAFVKAIEAAWFIIINDANNSKRKFISLKTCMDIFVQQITCFYA